MDDKLLSYSDNLKKIFKTIDSLVKDVECRIDDYIRHEIYIQEVLNTKYRFTSQRRKLYDKVDSYANHMNEISLETYNNKQLSRYAILHYICICNSMIAMLDRYIVEYHAIELEQLHANYDVANMEFEYATSFKDLKKIKEDKENKL